ncbi:FAD-dependent oxidoreductase [Hyphomonas sp.]|uniref:FAD-dependent oxidoreductase n=1 Tax=Hyphomonas sp. TaxID=87 RepID=UPI00391987F4
MAPTPSSANPHRPRIAIIGAGIIGLSIGFELAVRRGVPVTLYDTGAPGRGASWAAAGMIAPAFEAAGEAGAHPRLFDLCLESAALWPGFAAELEAASGLASGYAAAPALAAAMDGREAARLEAIAQTLAARGVAHRMLDGAGLRRAEPALSPQVLSGLELETDTRVDNRRTVAALIRALEACPLASFRAGPAPLKSAGRTVVLEGHDAVIAAAGWQTAVIKVEEAGGLYSLVNWDTALDDIDCYGGQMLSVAPGDGTPGRVVRSGDVYLVPRGGQVVIGATVEPFIVPDGADEAATEALRQAAIALCPGLEAAPVTERWAGVRPGTPDHAPFLGETAAPGLFVAAGHYRNGILLAPITARIMADLVTGRDAGALAATFSPRRAYTATA